MKLPQIIAIIEQYEQKIINKTLSDEDVESLLDPQLFAQSPEEMDADLQIEGKDLQLEGEDYNASQAMQIFVFKIVFATDIANLYELLGKMIDKTKPIESDKSAFAFLQQASLVKYFLAYLDYYQETNNTSNASPAMMKLWFTKLGLSESHQERVKQSIKNHVQITKEIIAQNPDFGSFDSIANAVLVTPLIARIQKIALQTKGNPNTNIALKQNAGGKSMSLTPHGFFSEGSTYAVSNKPKTPHTVIFTPEFKFKDYVATIKQSGFISGLIQYPSLLKQLAANVNSGSVEREWADHLVAELNVFNKKAENNRYALENELGPDIFFDLSVTAVQSYLFSYEDKNNRGYKAISRIMSKNGKAQTDIKAEFLQALLDDLKASRTVSVDESVDGSVSSSLPTATLVLSGKIADIYEQIKGKRPASVEKLNTWIKDVILPGADTKKALAWFPDDYLYNRTRGLDAFAAFLTVNDAAENDASVTTSAVEVSEDAVAERKKRNRRSMAVALTQAAIEEENFGMAKEKTKTNPNVFDFGNTGKSTATSTPQQKRWW